MALVHLNSIAALDSGGVPIGGQTYTFVDIEGNPQFAQQQHELLQRAGINGTFARKTGVRGTPFQLVTRGYVADYATTVTAMTAYRALVDNNYGVQLTRHSVVYATPLLLLAVEEIDQRACLNAVGVAGNPQVYHIVRWNLIAS
jgi:hypothetical protein